MKIVETAPIRPRQHSDQERGRPASPAQHPLQGHGSRQALCLDRKAHGGALYDAGQVVVVTSCCIGHWTGSNGAAWFAKRTSPSSERHEPDKGPGDDQQYRRLDQRRMNPPPTAVFVWLGQPTSAALAALHQLRRNQVRDELVHVGRNLALVRTVFGRDRR